jgi:hypothetical protein
MIPDRDKTVLPHLSNIFKKAGLETRPFQSSYESGYLIKVIFLTELRVPTLNL